MYFHLPSQKDPAVLSLRFHPLSYCSYPQNILPLILFLSQFLNASNFNLTEVSYYLIFSVQLFTAVTLLGSVVYWYCWVESCQWCVCLMYKLSKPPQGNCVGLYSLLVLTIKALRAICMTNSLYQWKTSKASSKVELRSRSILIKVLIFIPVLISSNNIYIRCTEWSALFWACSEDRTQLSFST